MRTDAVTADAVHATLRAIRAARPLTDEPLLALAAVTEGLRAERVSDTPAARASFLQTWLERITADELDRLRGGSPARGPRPASAGVALEDLRTDFEAGSTDREAWGALHFHYFAGNRVKLREASAALSLGYNTLRRRLERGYALLATAVRAAEQATGARAVAGRGVPHPLTRFIGRERELAAIRGLMAQHRLVTLVGPGGIGKSRLAIQLAADLAPDVPDGVTFVDLATVNDERHVPSACVAALGLREAPGGRPVDQLIQFLADQALLLVVDNCEHVVGASSALLSALLAGTARLRVLATSREELLVDGAAAWAVPPMSIPPADATLTSTALLHFDATRLFAARAATSAGRPLADSEAVQVARIAAALEGIPLAIELAAARTRVLSLDQLEARLADRFALLKDGRSNARPAHATLWAAIAWSYELLTAEEQALFRRLSAFRGGWTLEAAEAVCAGGALAAPDILTLLSQLAAKSLVYRMSDGAEPRFGMLETLRQFAEAQETSNEERQAAWANHLAYLADLATAAAAAWEGPDQDVWYRRLQADDANLAVAMERAWEGLRLEDGLRLGAALERYWIRSGQVPRGRRMVDGLARAAAGRSSLAHAQLQCAAAGLALVNLDRPALAQHAQLARDMAERLGDAHTSARAGLVAGIARFELGEQDEGVADLRATADRARALGDRHLFARCLSSLARFGELQGRRGPAAAEAWRAVVEAAEDGGPRDVRINAHERLAGYAFANGDLNGMADHVAASLAACGADDWSPVVGMAHRTAGKMELMHGAFDRARAHFETALFIGRRSGQPALTSSAVMFLGELEAEAGDFRRSREYAEQAVRLASAGGAAQTAFRAYELLFRLAVVTGDIEVARDHLAEMAVLESTHPAANSGGMMAVYRMTMARIDGDAAGAAVRVAAALRAALDESEEWRTIDVLWEAALLGLAMERPVLAARLAGAIGAHIERIGWTADWYERGVEQRVATTTRAMLGEQGAANARRDGRGLSFRQAVEEALNVMAHVGAAASMRAPRRPSS